MIYMVLESAELQMARIRNRVREGGHDVPVDKVIARRRKSFEELAWFTQHVDRCWIFDNSIGDPKRIAEKSTGSTILCWDTLPADLMDSLVKGGVELLDF